MLVGQGASSVTSQDHRPGPETLRAGQDGGLDITSHPGPLSFLPGPVRHACLPGVRLCVGRCFLPLGPATLGPGKLTFLAGTQCLRSQMRLLIALWVPGCWGLSTDEKSRQNPQKLP